MHRDQPVTSVDFPPVTGPWQVGSIDVELPVAELRDPVEAPPAAATALPIATIQYRIFYPCSATTVDAKGKAASELWVPHPQRQRIAALVAAMGVGRLGASLLS